MATTLKEGDKAPDFDLPTDGGGRFRLSKQRGSARRGLLLPEGRHVRLHPRGDRFQPAEGRDFDELETLIVGLSPDSPSDHDKFKAKHDLAIVLAADEDKKAAEAYGVVGREIDVRAQVYGRRPLDLPGRP